MKAAVSPRDRECSPCDNIDASDTESGSSAIEFRQRRNGSHAGFKAKTGTQSLTLNKSALSHQVSVWENEETNSFDNESGIPVRRLIWLWPLCRTSRTHRRIRWRSADAPVNSSNQDSVWIPPVLYLLDLLSTVDCTDSNPSPGTNGTLLTLNSKLL
jgi:hypothetical protein